MTQERQDGCKHKFSCLNCGAMLPKEANTGNWRVGGKVPLNVYEGDTPMFQCHTPEQAARVVALPKSRITMTLEQMIELEKSLPDRRWMVDSLDWERDGETQLDYFTHDAEGNQVFRPAFRIPELNTLGNHECGAMEKLTAEFVVALRNAAPELLAVVAAAQELDAAHVKYEQACLDADPDDLDGPGDPEMGDYFTIEMWEALRSALAKLEERGS